MGRRRVVANCRWVASGRVLESARDPLQAAEYQLKCCALEARDCLEPLIRDYDWGKHSMEINIKLRIVPREDGGE
jgi:hypothetical protein